MAKLTYFLHKHKICICTFSFVGKELIHLSNSAVISTHHKTMVVHVQDNVLSLCGMGMGESKHDRMKSESAAVCILTGV